MKKKLYYFFLLLGCLYNIGFAQIPTLSYSPSTDVLTLNTAFTLSPTSTGVAAFAYGSGIQLTGASLNNPWGMAIDPSGNIYVTNYNSGNNNGSSISKYNSAGVYQGTFGTTANLAQPSGITFDSFGNAYVLNYNRTNNGLGNNHGNGYVDQYSSSGVYQSTIVQGLGSATGIAADASNDLYVAMGSYNSGFNTVSQYNTSGAVAFSIAAGQTANPVAVAVDGSYNIYVLDNTNQKVYKFNSSGTYISTVITGLNNPNAIYVDGAGDIYVGDSGTGTVNVYNASGTLLTTVSGLTDPRGIVTDSKGNLYVSDYTNNTVTKYPPVGGYYLSATLFPGLSFSSTTGVFSGTPTTGFLATPYIVTAYNALGSASFTETLSCPSSAPTITYDPNSVNVFTTNSAITSLVPTTTGSPGSYSISATLPSGLSFSTSTGTISGTPTATSAATVYTVTATNAFGSGTCKISIATVVENFWTGKQSSDWNDKQNWSAKRVPVASDLASVGVQNYSGPDPIIDPLVDPAEVSVNVSYVTFGAANAATLTVKTGGSLTVNNLLTISDKASPIFTGTGTGAINIAPSAVVDVVGTGALTINSPLTFTLQSGSTGSASVDQITSGLIVGSVSVQRFITGGSGYRGYRLLSSPVYASTVSSNKVCSINYLKNSCFIKGTTGTTGGFDAAGNPNIYLYRENLAPSNASFISGNFRGINNITASPSYSLDVDGSGFNIPAGNGFLFFFRGDRNATGQTITTESVTSYVPTNTTLTATGTLIQGAVTVKDWYTPGSSNLGNTNTAGNSSIRGFNLVGNPYACSIDWDTYSQTAATAGVYAPSVNSFIYVLDPVNQNYNVYPAGYGGVGTMGNNSNIIPSGQGFFVQTSSASAQLVFNEAAKIPLLQANSTNGNLYLGKPVQAAVSQYLQLRLTKDSINSINKDGILISFSSTAQPGFVYGEDAAYKPGSGSVSISSMSADHIALAINSQALPQLAPAVIPLNVKAAVDGTYQLNLSAVKSIPALYDIWLKDAYAKDSLDIKHNPTYTFTLSHSDTATFGSNRFSLVIRQNPALMVHLLNFAASKVTDGNEVVWTTENEQNYTNFTVERSTDGGTTFNIMGGVPSSALGTYTLLDKAPVQGPNAYRLKMTDLNGTTTYSSVITIMYGNTGKHITINNLSLYPNPTAERVNLAITQNNPGTSVIYNIQIVNAMGSVIKTATSNQPNWQTDVSSLMPGTYFVEVKNNNTNALVGKSGFVKL